MSRGRMGRLRNEKFLGGITVNLKGWRNNREYLVPIDGADGQFNRTFELLYSTEAPSTAQVGT